ncbi:hypothetical protein THARTR1_07431 [Trichoderma harzianum]|uniref:GPI anchored protein n=1 Tax=Trichoderma harzianum TaxID=5544 RepID=A0A2K0U369_TRIHA|nr:hypothetical protein THARTR1_07431 [Trichoderma harzianum]
MARSLALLVALSSAAAVAAQSTTVSLLLPLADRQKLVGSVIGVDSAATTYAYGCAPGTPSDDCGFESSQTIAQGPTTWIYTNIYSDDEGVASCKLSSAADVASCTAHVAATNSAGSVTSTGSVGTESFLSFQLPVTITAGLEKLQASPGASATDDSTAAPTNTGASETSQATASASASSTTLARQTTAQSTGTRTASTTAAPNSTNAAGLVNAQNGLLAGVAAVVGGVMML